jgi:hypothetical protein
MGDNVKMKILAAFAVAAVLTFTGLAQEIPSEPEFVDVFFLLDAGKLVPLERQATTVQTKVHGFIAMSMKTSYEIAGAKSPVRLRSDGALDFVVRSPLTRMAVDPSTQYFIWKLNSNKKARELVMMVGHASPVGATVNNNPGQGGLPLTFTRYGASSLQITAGLLAPGEYALGRPFAQTVFCFGVD